MNPQAWEDGAESRELSAEAQTTAEGQAQENDDETTSLEADRQELDDE